MKQPIIMISLSFVCNMAYADSDLNALNTLLSTQITGASRYEQPLVEAPSQATVITNQDIQKRGLRTIAEALQTANGTYTNNTRDYSHIGIRGFLSTGDYNSRFLLLNDGIRLNDPLYDSALIGHESPLDINWVKRIEYVSGPGSSLYGGNAIFGTANVITYSGADINGSKISLEAQSDNRYRTSFITGNQLTNGDDYIIGLSAGGGHGGNLYFPNQGWAQKLDGENYTKAYLKANISEWLINAGASQRNKDIPTGYWGTAFNLSGTFNTDDYYYLNLTRHYEVTNDLSQQVRFRYGQYNYSGQYNYGSYLTSEWGKSQWYGLEYSINYHGITNHRINGGLEIQDNKKLSLGTSSGLNHTASNVSYGVYIQDQWALTPTLIQYVGIRLDKINDQSAISPKWSVVHRTGDNTLIRMSTGQAFRPPNQYERFYTDNNPTPGYLTNNLELKNEYIRNTEINIDHALNAGLLANFTLYHFELINHIEQLTNSDGLLQFTNNGTLVGNGIEISTRYQYDELKIQAGITQQHIKNNFSPATNSPHLVGKLFIENRIPTTNFIASLSLFTSSKVYNNDHDKLSAYSTSNLVISEKKSNQNGMLSIGVYNLFNQKYMTPSQSSMTGPGIYQDRRIVRVKWDLSF